MKCLRHATALATLLGLLGSGCERAPDPSGPDADRTGAGIPSYKVTGQSGPANDDFRDATVIAALPFSGTVDIAQATTQTPDELPPPCAFGNSSGRTVWYTLTTSSTGGWIAVWTSAGFSTVVAAYTGTSLTGLTEVGCLSPFQGLPTLRVLTEAGTTYYFQVDGMFGQSGALDFHVAVIPPPSNDNFAAAIAIPALPYTNVVDLTAATAEAQEPIPSCAGPASRSAWYAFTPTATGSVSAGFINAPWWAVVTAYTGTLGDLNEVRCGAFGGKATFRAVAGTTYYFQVHALGQERGPVEFNLDVAPPPVANFGLNLSDPSVFDVVQFFNFSFDPGGVSFEAEQWDFGDGTTGTSCCPTHQYAADGDYAVTLTVTTLDGRTASATQTLLVRTHDVAITKFSVPKSASAGQTRGIVVGINSRRYGERVEVQLFKSIPGGFQFVGSLIQSVPVRPSNRTTDFTFSYTFTADDARVGKVTFRAVANITTGRDALPADNEAIAAPTTVSR